MLIGGLSLLFIGMVLVFWGTGIIVVFFQVLFLGLCAMVLLIFPDLLHDPLIISGFICGLIFTIGLGLPKRKK